MADELIVHLPDGTSQRTALLAERFTVGRAATNNLHLADDGRLSRHHLAFEKTPTGWAVVDLGSRNGTFLNGERVDRSRPLKLGDQVLAGQVRLQFGGGPDSTSGKVVFTDTAREAERSATVVLRLDGVLGGTDGLAKPETPAKDTSARMRALMQAGRELADHRPLDELFPLILKLAAEAVGSTHGVLMLEEAGQLNVRATLGRHFEISRTVRDRVMEARESLLIQDTSLDEKLRHQESIVAQSVRSILAVPLQAKDRVIGLLYLDSPIWVRAFTVEDLSLLTVMANIAAIRLEHARLTEVEHRERLMAREMAQAAEIQRGLLPRQMPVRAGLEVAGFSEACLTVGGDHFDFYQRGQRLMALVGDVAGKGMPAALLAASLQARVQVLAEVEPDLARLVERLNRVICSNCPGNRFITFFVCELDEFTGEVSYVNAGHNPPLVLRRDGSLEKLDGGGMVLGLFGGARYEAFSARLEPGDILAMYSDGVTEAEATGTEEDFGEDRLAASLQGDTLDDMLENVKSAVAAHAGSVPAADDFTLVLLRRT